MRSHERLSEKIGNHVFGVDVFDANVAGGDSVFNKKMSDVYMAASAVLASIAIEDGVGTDFSSSERVQCCFVSPRTTRHLSLSKKPLGSNFSAYMSSSHPVDELGSFSSLDRR